MDFEKEVKISIEACSPSTHPINQLRRQKLEAINNYYTNRGYPVNCSLNNLSLIPAYFQEAIYDSINWTNQNASLEHLEKQLELDCMFHNEGMLRKELSQTDFEKYIQFSTRAINGISQKPKKPFPSWLILKLKGS